MSDNQFYESFEELQPNQTDLNSNELVLNMGPQHPSTHGVLRVILKLDGEKVNGLECVIGYLHRGIEKVARKPYLGAVSHRSWIAWITPRRLPIIWATAWRWRNSSV